MKRNMNFRYFCYHFKTTLLRMAIIVFICVIISGSAAHEIVSTYNEWAEEMKEYESDPCPDWCYIHRPVLNLRLTLGIFAVMSILLNIILPTIELSIFNNRKYLDSGFTFPISRTSLISSHLLTGFIHSILSFSLSYILYAILLLRCKDCFDHKYIWGFFFVTILWSAFFYLFNAFFFSMCNSTADGVVTALCWQILLAPLMLTISDNTDIDFLESICKLGIVWLPYTDMCQYFTSKAAFNTYSKLPEYVRPLLRNTPKNSDLDVTPIIICYLCITTLLAVIFFLGIVFFFKRKRAENAGEISNSIVSYKFLIPLGVSMLLIFAFDTSLTLCSLIALIASTIAYIIYRRGVKLKFSDLVVIGICFACFVMGIMA